MTERIEVNEARPIRVLGPHEQGRFAPEAWGYLVGLGRAGVLEPLEMEQVIDRVLAHFEGRISVSELRLVLGDPETDDGASAPGVTLH